ncbi:MAG: hypothetical protein AB1444_03530 [Spirochaetota bacterium]
MKLRTMIIVLFLSITVTLPLHAGDLGVGVSGWYADWKMYNPDSPDDKTTKMDPAFCIGPSISYQFTQSWSTTLVALFTPIPYEMTNENSETTKIRRYDSDLVINYQLLRYLKFFFGGKYLGFTYNDGIHHGAGPGGGIGLTIPVIGNFYFLGNASVLYLWGSHKDNAGTRDFTEYGYNTAVQLAYYAASAGLTTSIGYRYQLIKSKYDTDDPYGKKDEHTFKGFTFLIVKSFHWE